MAKAPANVAASVKQRLLNMARAQGQVLDVVLIRFALERLLYRLAKSDHRDRFILKGGMLVTLWLEEDNRVTRDMDFLGRGNASEEELKAVFAEIMAIECNDGLKFDVDGLSVTAIREEMQYGGTRLRTVAYLERTRIPVTLDVAFGDAIAAGPSELVFPSLLDMEAPKVRAYPPATLIAEKFQAMVALGAANSRMKDYYDLWAIPRTLSIDGKELDDAMAATFARRRTDIPADRPVGLSAEFIGDELKQRQWRAYARSIELDAVSLDEVVEAVWALVGPSCERLLAADPQGRSPEPSSGSSRASTSAARSTGTNSRVR
jgi:predicted nucleotidyltransferase component of viral defense system